MYVEYCFRTMAVAVKERVADSDHQAKVKHAVRIVRNSGPKGITVRDLNRKAPFSRYKYFEQQDILKALKNNVEEVRFVKISKDGAGRPREVFLHISYINRDELASTDSLI